MIKGFTTQLHRYFSKLNNFLLKMHYLSVSETMVFEPTEYKDILGPEITIMNFLTKAKNRNIKAII